MFKNNSQELLNMMRKCQGNVDEIAYHLEEQKEWNDKTEKRLRSFNHALRNAEKSLGTLELLTPKTWFNEFKAKTQEHLSQVDQRMQSFTDMTS